MNQEERSKLIAKYSDGFNEVSDALKDFPAELMTARPLPGKWTAREIIHHLADSESASALRLRKLLVEDQPLIQGYDQDQFAIHLKYNERDTGPALDAFRAARATTAQVLSLMSDDDWQRAGEHSESGRYTAETWLTIYAEHAYNHAAQIRRLRSALNI